MADVFVSYSRRDSGFVDRLVEALRERGKDVWVDTAGIRDAEVFPAALREAVEQSDGFVFVISPDAVSSRFCEQEVDRALGLNKRIVPLLLRPVADERVPEGVRVRNWIPVGEDGEFAAGVDRLVTALDTDLAWAKEHTRWLVRALEWDGQGRERSLLLRGTELKAAEAWLARAPADADPAPTPLQREYVLAGRAAAARRQRALMGASLAVAAISIGLLIFALISRGQAVSQRVAARAQALAAESQAQLSNDPEISLLLAQRAVRTKATPQGMLSLRDALDASPLLRSLPTAGPPGSCNQNSGLSLAYRPRHGQIAEGACNGTLLLVDPANGRTMRKEHLSLRAPSVAYSQDGSSLAVGTDHGVALVNPDTGAVTARLQGPPTVAVAFSPDGRRLAADNPGGTTVWTLPGGRARDLVLSQHDMGSIAFSPDGRWIAVGGDDSASHVYDARTGRQVHEVRTPQSCGCPGSWPEVVAFSPDGSYLAVGHPSGGPDNPVSLYSTRTWKRLFDVAALRANEVASVAFSPDGRRLAIGGEDGTAGIWSIRSRQQVVSYEGPTAAVGSMAFSSDGRTVATAANDGTARLWRASGPELASFDTGLTSNNFQQLVLVGDSLTYVAALNRGQVVARTVRLATGRQVSAFSLPPKVSGGLSPDARLVITSPIEKTGRVQLRRMPGLRLVRTLAANAFLQWSDFQPDGSHAILEYGVSPGPDTKAIQVVDLRSGKSVSLDVPADPCAPVTGLVFSRDGRRVAGSTFCGSAYVWDTSTGRVLRRVSEGGEVSGVGLTPDGSRLVVGSWDSRATVWDVASGHVLLTLIGHTRGITGIGFDRTGAFIATTSLDHTIRIWDARTGQPLRILQLGDVPWGLTASSDDRRVAAVDDAGVLRVWDACPACGDPEALLAAADRRGAVRLTALERTVVAKS